MSLNLSDVLSYTNSNQSNKADAVQQAASASDVVRSVKTAMALNSLMQGQTIAGIVKQVSGEQILLDLGQNIELSAKLDSGIDVTAGKNLLFEVKSNQNGKINLSPLYTNLSTDSTAGVSALKAAGLPLSHTNMSMVQTMMQEGLSVDKSSLWDMNKSVAANAGFPPENVVHLRAMNIPVNSENLTQFQNYQNQNHQMLQSIENLMASIESTALSFGVQNQNAGVEFMHNMLQAFVDNGMSMEAAENLVSDLATEPVGQLPLDQSTASAATENQRAPENSIYNEVQQNQAGVTDSKTVFLNTVSQILQESVTSIPDQNQTGMAKLTEFVKQFGEFMNTDDVNLSKEEYQNVGKAFSKLLSTQIKTDWLMKPEEFGDKERVKEFYQKVTSQTDKMSQVFADAGKDASPAGKAVVQLNQNLHFMQDVNQAFPYLQIPLKTAMENAHGDLYVYTKKKSSGGESEDQVTALLHLEMEHLGNLDVYVKMQKQNVSTHFTLEDESMIDFLASHMELLSERLQNKGYHLNSEITTKENASEDVINHIRGISNQKVPVIMNSFDVRA